jgi:hypothetical protein
MINLNRNLALCRVKHANFFADFFGENISKNHNIGPWVLEIAESRLWSSQTILFFIHLSSVRPRPSGEASAAR